MLHNLKRRSSKDWPMRTPLWSSSEKVSDGLVISQMKGMTEVQIIGIKWERRTLEVEVYFGEIKTKNKGKEI